MVEQLEQFKEKIDDKEDELQQVTAQLEISQREKLNIEMQMDSMVKQLEEERGQLQVSIMSIISVAFSKLARVTAFPMFYSGE